MRNTANRSPLLPSLAIAIGMITASCGSNFFEDAESEKDPGLQAARYLEESKPDEAIEVILNALDPSFTNNFDADIASLTSTYAAALANSPVEGRYALVSLLSAAVAQKAGFDPLELALKFAEDGGSETSNSDITALFPALPDTTATNIAGFDKALAILNAITGDNQTAADIFKKSLLLTATTAMRTKQLDLDGDGKISALEAANLSDTDAAIILSQIEGAITTLSGGTDSTLLESTSAATSTLQGYLSTVDNSEGATREEQLRNYLSSR